MQKFNKDAEKNLELVHAHCVQQFKYVPSLLIFSAALVSIVSASD